MIDFIDRAKLLAQLFGGNGLSQNQQIVLIADQLEQWSIEDQKKSLDIINP